MAVSRGKNSLYVVTTCSGSRIRKSLLSGIQFISIRAFLQTAQIPLGCAEQKQDKPEPMIMRIFTIFLEIWGGVPIT